MSDRVADLMLKNRQELFNERDAARRIAAVKSIYAKEAEIFEGKPTTYSQRGGSLETGRAIAIMLQPNIDLVRDPANVWSPKS